jgi:hypothetical protein
VTAGSVRSFLHSQQAESRGAWRTFAQRRRIEAYAIVFDDHLEQRLVAR